MLARKCDSAMDANARAERGALSKEQAPWLDCNFFCVTQTNHQQRRKRTLEVAGKMALDGDAWAMEIFQREKTKKAVWQVCKCVYVSFIYEHVCTTSISGEDECVWWM